jgi:hypothetical protein
MTGRVARPRPRAEVLLEAAHRDVSIVHEHHAALVRAGITADRLPDEVTRMAFALLGGHDRAGVVRELEAHWETLLHKGLARGAIGAAATPLLRLLAHALPATAEIAHVWQRLQAAGDAPAAPPAVFRCASRVEGLWGQPARVHFQADDASYVLIAPDVVFGRQSALVAADASGRCAGYFSVPVEDGTVTCTLLRRNAEIVRHVTRFACLEGQA